MPETTSILRDVFAPCPMCKQYSHSIGEDQLAEAFNHFQSMFSHRGDGIPTQYNFDEKTRDAAQVLMAAARSLPEATEGERVSARELLAAAEAVERLAKELFEEERLKEARPIVDVRVMAQVGMRATKAALSGNREVVEACELAIRTGVEREVDGERVLMIHCDYRDELLQQIWAVIGRPEARDPELAAIASALASLPAPPGEEGI